MKRFLNWVELFFVSPVLIYRRIYIGEGLWAKVSVMDYFWLKKFQWILYGNGASIYAVTSKLVGPKKAKLISMHRLIMNQPRGRLIDHRNCDSFDNRRQNLRSATNAQNQQNRKKTMSKCTSKYKGVRLLKDTRRSKPWQANILVKKKMKFLGNYSTEIEAAKAYDRAAIKYYGDFARLNFPQCRKDSRGIVQKFICLVRLLFRRAIKLSHSLIKI